MGIARLHGLATAWAAKRVYRVSLPDQTRPRPPEDKAGPVRLGNRHSPCSELYRPDEKGADQPPR